VSKNPRIHIAKGYAIVSPGGKIQVDTCGPTKAYAEQYLSTFDEAKGNKVMQVSVVVTMPADHQ
jgi:hypothetical protein